MTKPTDPPGDDIYIRCPRLGHQIYFSYCRSENKGIPCFKTLDCWHGHFDVEAFLRTQLNAKQWEAIFVRKVRPKVLTLVELIEKAQKKPKDAS